MIPYDAMDFPSKVAYIVSDQMYAYSPTNTICLPRYRSNNRIRSDFVLTNEQGQQKFLYHNDLSTDQTGAWQSGSCIVIGFRGTDTADPMRYLNYIPKDYENDIMHEINRIDPGSFRLDRFPYSNSRELCKCSQVVCPLDVQKSGVTRENILSAVNEKYCKIEAAVIPLPKRGYETTARRDDINFGELRGGMPSRANEYSDCIADIKIARTSIPGVNVINSDIKHRQAIKDSLNIINNFQKKYKLGTLTIIFCGHSLGGSLAMNAYLNCFYEDSLLTKTLFVGFNSAVLGNFSYENNLRRNNLRKPENYKVNSVIHYRNSNDGVSNGMNYVPNALGQFQTITFTKTNDFSDKDSNNTDTLSHGLWTFQECAVKPQNMPVLDFTFTSNLDFNFRILSSSKGAYAPRLAYGKGGYGKGPEYV